MGETSRFLQNPVDDCTLKKELQLLVPSLLQLPNNKRPNIVNPNECGNSPDCSFHSFYREDSLGVS
jgi:hypothetical protein